MSQRQRRITNFCVSRLCRAFCFFHRYRIAQVRTVDERGQHDRLVQKIFFESRIFESPDTELTAELDGSVCKSFVARFKGKAVGALTVVRHPQKLPVQEFFNIQLPPGVETNQVAEVTRFVIEPQHRRQPPMVSLGLLNSALDYSRQQKIRWWICCFPSVFIWTFQAFFRDCIVLEQLPLKPEQIEMRKGRESFFAPERCIRVILVDLDSIDMTNAMREFWKRYRRGRSKKTG